MDILTANLEEEAGPFPYPDQGKIFNIYYQVKPGNGTFGDNGVNVLRFKLFHGPEGDETPISLASWGGSDHWVESTSSAFIFPNPFSFPSMESLPPGRYRAEIEHYSDNEAEEYIFTRHMVFHFDPPEEEEDEYTPYLFSEGFQKYITLDVQGSSNNWLISDTAIYTPPAGYERYYRVGNQLVRQSGLLTNHPWQSNQPVDVQVWFVKTSLPDLNTWIHPLQHGGEWGDPNGGVTLDKSDIGAFSTILFLKNSAPAVPTP